MQDKKNICLGFIIYNPEDSVAQRIKMVTEAGYFCYIFDNTPEKSVIRNQFQNNANVKYSTAGKNAGLGIGMSVINGEAYFNGFEALLFFDQDTGFSLETLMFIENFHKKNQNLKTRYSSVVFNAKNLNNCAEEFCTDNVLLSISSGSLFFLEPLKKIGFHNTSFFVDCVDYELCLNSDNNGFQTLECTNTPGFDHVTEQADKPYQFFGRTLMLRAYPSTRVWGTVSSSFRLFFMAIGKLNFKYAYAMLRSVLIYSFFQILVRILNIIK